MITTIALSESRIKLACVMPNVWRYLKGKQLEAFWERYQREGVPNDLSMQAFCSMHNVPYNCFERHVRQRAKFKKIEPVLITDIPEEKTESGASVAEVTNNYIKERLDAIQDEPEEKDDKVRILVSIKMSNGFQIHRSNIDYRTLLGHHLVTAMTAATHPATVHIR